MEIIKTHNLHGSISPIHGLSGSLSKQQGSLTGTLSVPQTTESRDYNRLTNKPKINSIELVGDKSSEDLFLQSKMEDMSLQEIDDIIFG